MNLLSMYANIPKDYETGTLMTMQEIHTLGYICKAYEISISELGKKLHKTKGAISQMADKLEKKGLIVRKKSDANPKLVLLVPTEAGRKTDFIHRAYDREAVLATLNTLSQHFTPDEIEAYYKVMKAHTQIHLNKTKA